MSGSLPQPDSRWPSLFAFLGALVLAAVLFLIIPLTQALNYVDPDPIVYREMVLAAPPPPPQMPPPPEELTSHEVTVEPEPPQMEQQVEDVPIQRIALDLSPGMGVALNMGMPNMPAVEKVDLVAEIEKIFNFDELAQPPNIINGRMIRVEYPRALARRGIKEVKVVLEILIDKTGRVKVEKMLSTTFDHELVRVAARRAAEQARFTVTKVSGRAVAVRGRFPLTLQAPR